MPIADLPIDDPIHQFDDQIRKSSIDYRKGVEEYVKAKKAGVVSRASDYAKKLEQTAETKRIDSVSGIKKNFSGVHKVIELANRASNQKVYLEQLMIESYEMHAHMYNLVRTYNKLASFFEIELCPELIPVGSEPAENLQSKMKSNIIASQNLRVGISKITAIVSRASQLQTRASAALQLIDEVLEPSIPDELLQSLDQLYISDDE